MILFPFSFLAGGKRFPINITPPSIYFSAINTVSWNVGVWKSRGTAITSREWFVNDDALSVSVNPLGVELGDSIYIKEEGELDGNFAIAESTVLTLPTMLSAPVITQPTNARTTYTTPAVWDNTVTSVQSRWVVNGVISAFTAVVGAVFTPSVTLGAVDGDVISVAEIVNGQLIAGFSNTFVYDTLRLSLADEGAVEHSIEGLLGVAYDTPNPTTINGSVEFTIEGSLV